jgi:nickel transport protein
MILSEQINRVIWFVGVLAAVLMFSGTAGAHKVTVFAWVEGDTVFTESKLGGGKRVVEGDISVTDGDENILLTGKTNHQGEFSFKTPQKPPLTIVLDAGMGHRATWTIEAEDAAPVADQAAETNQIPEEKTAPSPVSAAPDAKQLETVLEKIIDRKLSPVIKMLADSQQRDPSLTDIIGGIGYIFGLVGIAAYFKSLRR